MNYTIRHYKKNDYEMISSWWKNSNKEFPSEEFMSEETSFILEMLDKPALCITIYLTNCKGVCFLENFIGNPEFKGEERKKASKFLVNFCYAFSKNMNYKNIMAFGIADKLTTYYKDLGMTPINSNVTSFLRSL